MNNYNNFTKTSYITKFTISINSFEKKQIEQVLIYKWVFYTNFPDIYHEIIFFSLLLFFILFLV